MTMAITPQELLKVQKQLILHEGKKGKPYTDTVGKLTIGVGRNLTDVGITDEEILYLLGNDIRAVEAHLNYALPWWVGLNDVRRRVLIDMCFNLGITKLLTFKNTLRAMQEARYGDAAEGMLNSLWAKQVGQRAVRLAKMMRTGVDYELA